MVCIFTFLNTLLFLLTHLLRGATFPFSFPTGQGRDFYSRTSCEVRRSSFLSAESVLLFLLTHLLRGATFRLCDIITSKDFYSRTSCEVRHTVSLVLSELDNFYSRTSCEVRRWNNEGGVLEINFYSRTSCEVRLARDTVGISTHAPLARCDFSGKCRCSLHQFLLTHLLRGATLCKTRYAR